MKYALNQIIKKPCVATIGTFDGVHRGHQYVVRQVVSQARQRGLESVVLTFPNHPLQVLQDGFQPQMLTLPQEKERHLLLTGIDQVEMMPFTQALAQMKAYDFMLKFEKNMVTSGMYKC